VTEQRIDGLLAEIRETKEKRDRLENRLAVLQHDLGETRNTLQRLEYEQRYSKGKVKT
jgi:chromosome segregation ATPase